MAATVFCASLAVYLCTIAPTLTYGGDCGELVSASHTLGVAHPTGYPLYILLGKLFSLLVPWGDVAFRYNLLSAVCAAGAASIVAMTIAMMTGSALGGLTGGMMLAVSYIFWSQAIIAEVYALNAFLLAWCLFFYQQWIRERDNRYLFSLGASLGLGMANHSSTLFVGLACLVALIYDARSHHSPGTPRRMRITGLCVLAPLALYAYLPLRAAQHPAMNWGDPSNLGRFLVHITGRLYREHVFGLPLGKIPGRILELASLMGLQFLLTNLFAVYGTICLFRERQPMRVLTGVLCAVLLIVYLPYDVGDVWVFFIPLFLLWCLSMGVGVAAVERGIVAASPTGEAGPRYAYAAILLFLIAFQCYVTFPRANMRGHTYARDDALQVIESTGGKGAVLTGTDELLFSLWYLQQVEHRGQGLRIEPMPHPEKAWGDGKLQSAIESSLSRGPVYASFWIPALQSKFACRPRELVMQIEPGTAPQDRHSVSSAIPGYRFDWTTPPQGTKRGNLLVGDVIWTGATLSPIAGPDQYRFRLLARQPSPPTRALAPSARNLPGNNDVRHIETTQDHGWVAQWTTTYLLYPLTLPSPRRGEGKSEQVLSPRRGEDKSERLLPLPTGGEGQGEGKGAAAVPIWIPTNVLPLRYQLWGRVESLRKGEPFDTPAQDAGPWKPIGPIQVLDK